MSNRDASPWMRRSAALMIPAVLLVSPLASASPEAELSTTAEDERAPQVSCATPCEPARPCLIVHEFDDPSGDFDLRVQVVQVDGTITSGALPLASSYDDETNPAIASMVSADAYLLVLEHTAPGGQSELRARRIGYPRRPAIAGSTWDDYLVAWQEQGPTQSLDVAAAPLSFP